MPLTMLPAAREHLPDLAALYARTFNGPPWNDGWTTEAAAERLGRLMAHPDFVGVVALENGAAVAFAMGYAQRWVRGLHLHLIEMCVDPARQRSGLGGALLDAVVREARARGVDAIFLETRPGSPAAAFYRKHGFSPLRLESLILRLTASVETASDADRAE